MDTKCAKTIRAARSARSGKQKSCVRCRRPFSAWGDTCAKCRAGGASARRAAQTGAASGTACFVCHKRVYDAERLVAADRLFHRKSAGHPGCFRCAHCSVTLSATSFSCAPSRSKFFCLTHFKQLFATHGDYSFAEDETTTGAAVGQNSEQAREGESERVQLGAHVQGGSDEGSDTAARRASDLIAAADGSRAPASSLRVVTQLAAGDQATATRADGANFGNLERQPAEEREKAALGAATHEQGAEGDGAAQGSGGEQEEEEEAEAAPTCYMHGTLRIPFEIEDEWSRVREGDAARNWLLLAYRADETHTRSDGTVRPLTNPAAESVEIVGSGGGGLSECLRHASSDARVYWGGFRVVAIDEQRGVVSERPKRVFFMLAGPDTPLKQKARGLLDMGAIAEVLQQTHVSFKVESASELSERSVVEKLLLSGGAHRPNAWDFGDGRVLRHSET